MKRLTIALVVAGTALLPATASGHARSKVLRGEFTFIGADGDYVSGKFGKAQLVDGPKNDKLSVHVRRLASRTRYAFRLEQSARACEADAPAGTPVPGWTYRRGGIMKTSRKGVANSWARSTTFSAQPGVAYFVGVYSLTPAGTPDQLVLCAELRGKRHGKGGGQANGNGHTKHDDPQGTAHGHDKPADKGRGRDRSKAGGKDKPAKTDHGHDQSNAGGKDKPAETDHGQDQSNGRGPDKPAETGDQSPPNGRGPDKPAQGRGHDQSPPNGRGPRD